VIKQNLLQFDMDSGWNGFRNHLKRGKGHLLAYAWNRIKWDYFHRFNIVPQFPLNVDIEASSRCNLKCDHCFRQYMDMHESDYMSIDLYRKIVDECAKYKLFTLKFSMRGEPTLHPEIVMMIDYAKKKGIKEVWINTHGAQLTERMAEGFIKSGLDCLTVSFDGLGEMYESIRIPLKYEENLAKLKMFMKVRKRLRARKPIVKVQTLWSAIKDNPEEYLNVMGNIVDKVSYNIDFNFKDIHFFPDPDYVCYRLWQRIAITSEGDFLKLWDTKQQEERQRHLSGGRLQSSVCKKCHHGAKVVDDVKGYSGRSQNIKDIVYNGEFKGVGMNRQK
jgi:MoaA/NifB/PqqE/SkfB family radical SAM enzyme